MTTLSIDFQEGFDNDSILCKVNGTAVFSKNAVTTALLTGLADSIQLEIEKGKVYIEIVVKNRDLAKTIELDINEESYIGISLANDSISHIQSTEPFAYG